MVFCGLGCVAQLTSQTSAGRPKPWRVPSAERYQPVEWGCWLPIAGTGWHHCGWGCMAHHRSKGRGARVVRSP
jgi:hypothetical protein